MLIYIKTKTGMGDVSLFVQGKLLKEDMRLNSISVRPLIITVEEVMASEKLKISAAYNWTDNNNAVLKTVNDTLSKTENIVEPTAVLKEYSAQFLDGRALDHTSEGENDMTGETSEIMIGRYTIFENAITEILQLENIRYPLEVCFYGEMCEDFMGPRKEFLTLFLMAIKERLMTEDGLLVYNQDMVAKKGYYVAGIIIGLSAIQGGPCACFFRGLLSQGEMPLPVQEHYKQLEKGLERTGILQMFHRKPTLLYLFQKASTNLTVKSLTMLLKPAFHLVGSNKRMEEENAFSIFIRYLREVAARRRGDVTLQYILKFVTGSPDIPVIGYSVEPSIDFAALPGNFPTASSCINKLTLPINAGSDEDKIFDSFDLAFSNEYFGLK